MKIDLEKNYDKNRVVFWVGGIYCALVLVFLLALFWWNQRITPVDVSGCQVNGGQLMYALDKNYGSNFVKLEGYAYVPGQDIIYADISVLAYDPAGDKYYELPTEIVKKTNITKEAGDGFDYDNCGFSSVVLSRKLGNGTRFYIRCKNNGGDILADTGEAFSY